MSGTFTSDTLTFAGGLIAEFPETAMTARERYAKRILTKEVHDEIDRAWELSGLRRSTMDRVVLLYSVLTRSFAQS